MCKGTGALGRGKIPRCSWTMVLHEEKAPGSILMGYCIPSASQHHYTAALCCQIPLFHQVGHTGRAKRMMVTLTSVGFL